MYVAPYWKSDDPSVRLTEVPLQRVPPKVLGRESNR